MFGEGDLRDVGPEDGLRAAKETSQGPPRHHHINATLKV